MRPTKIVAWVSAALFASLPLLALAPRAGAAPPGPADAARGLADGTLAPADAAAAWEEAHVTPDDARERVARVPLVRAPAGHHRATLHDASGHESEALVRMPRRPRPDGRFGALVLLHGLRGDAASLLEFGQRIAPPGTIVIAPSALPLPDDEQAEDTFGLGFGQQLPHWWGYGERGLPLAALRYLQRRYPVDPDRVLLAGYSMGGFGTWNEGLRFHDRFAGLAPLAGGLSRAEAVVERDGRSRALLDNARMVPAFFVHGDQDTVVPVRMSRTIADDLRERQAEFVFEEVAGGPHVLMPFLAGDERTRRLQTWLGERRREAHPRRIEHAALGAYHGAAFWVRIDEVRGASGKVTAEVREGNVIVVTTRDVARLTLYLDPALVDVAAAVRVEVDGRVAHEGVVAPSLRAVAESYARALDPELTYAHALELRP